MRAGTRPGREAIRAWSLRRPPFAPGQTQHTGRTTVRGQEGGPARDDAKWERERARRAAPLNGGAEIGYPTRENNATQPTTTLPVELIRGSLGSDSEDATAGVTARNARRR